MEAVRPSESLIRDIAEDATSQNYVRVHAIRTLAVLGEVMCDRSIKSLASLVKNNSTGGVMYLNEIKVGLMFTTLETISLWLIATTLENCSGCGNTSSREVGCQSSTVCG